MFTEFEKGTMPVRIDLRLFSLYVLASLLLSKPGSNSLCLLFAVQATGAAYECLSCGQWKFPAHNMAGTDEQPSKFNCERHFFFLKNLVKLSFFILSRAVLVTIFWVSKLL